MRILHGVVVGAIAIAAVAVLPAGLAAAAAPVAPFNAIVVDGGAATMPMKGQLEFDPTNSTFYFGPDGTNNPLLESVQFTATSPTHSWSASMLPPLAAPLWVVGTTYATSTGPQDPSLAFFSTGGDFIGCDNEDGQLTVLEVGRNATTHRINKFAAIFSSGCDGQPNAISLDLRGNSNVPYVSGVGTTSLFDFGEVGDGAVTAAQSVTFTSRGSTPITFGAASLAGADPQAYSISSDTCSNHSFSYGQTCTVGVRAQPAVLGLLAANLVLPDNTAAGKKIVRLTMTGTDPQSISLVPASLDFGQTDLDVDSEPRTILVTANGPLSVTVGAASIEGTNSDAFAITANTCTGVVLAFDEHCAITVTAHPTVATFQNATLVLTDDTAKSPRTVPLSLHGGPSERGTYHALQSPQRIMDTRTGNGTGKSPIGPGGTVQLQVAGRAGLPVTGAGAAVLNVTVTGPTANGFLTVFPTGVVRPTASSLNFVKGWTGANSVTVALGQGGSLDIFNSAGSTQVIVDVLGYYSTAELQPPTAAGGQLVPTAPERLLDTRDVGHKVPAGSFVKIPVSYGETVDPHIRALVVNVTAVAPDDAGFLTAWNGDVSHRPATSTLNYTKGAVVPNFAIVPVMACSGCGAAEGMPSIAVFTSKNTHVLVDIVGLIDDATLSDGLRFSPITPSRITDTRIGLGVPSALGPATQANITTPVGLLSMPLTVALALNVTAVAPTAATYLTVWPTGLTRPTVSNLNPVAGQTIPNAAITLIGDGDAFSVYNHQGFTNVVIDAVGTYWLYPGTASIAGVSSRRQPLHTEHLGEYVRQAG